MAKASNVTTGKPAVIGAVNVAPLGTKLPTSADEELDKSFMNLGYITDDGMTNTNSLSSDSIQAWGGDTVLNVGSSKEDQWKFALMEALNPDVLKFVYGDENVTGDLDSGIVVKSNSKSLAAHVVVIDTLLAQNTAKRMVLPSATVTATDDVVYKDKTALTYGVTLSATPDESGNTHYEYIKKKADEKTPAAESGK